MSNEKLRWLRETNWAGVWAELKQQASAIDRLLDREVEVLQACARLVSEAERERDEAREEANQQRTRAEAAEAELRELREKQ